ncbi:uromodulin isoform X7 [Struthio camelus]|uniref:uromodulin isoform X7 n=1 Tax=Struthio camelus TaxID=8801 RepID=UPI0036041FC8
METQTLSLSGRARVYGTVTYLLLLPTLCLAVSEGNKTELMSPKGRREQFAIRLKRNLNACLPNPCQHQGDCQVLEDRSICNCKPGFRGAFCQDVVLKLACEEEHMKMMVRKEVFELLKIPQELVHLKNQACKVSEREEEGELFFAAILTGENHTACGSVIQQNSSHVSYSNIIESERKAHGGVISRSFQLEVHFDCVYAYEQVVKVPFALTAIDRLVQFVVKEGHFNVTMKLYKTPSYLQPYHHQPAAIPLTDTLYVMLKIEGQHQLRYFLLSVEDCWATPSSDPYQAVRHELIKKGNAQGTQRVSEHWQMTTIRLSPMDPSTCWLLPPQKQRPSTPRLIRRTLGDPTCGFLGA